METNRFYRPELDALRFFAFLAVLLHHGPAAPGFAGLIRDTGGLGLSMFFLLSAYLITELLLREREQSGTIVWRFFFVRRALRIWPLYFAAILAGVVLAWLAPRHFDTNRAGVAGLVFFVSNWFPGEPGRLLAPLWSISIEEQFYLVWPSIVKYGGQTLAAAMSVTFVITAGVWIWVFAASGWMLWYDTPVEFLFFASGVIMALATRGKPAPARRIGDRIFLLAAGLCLMALAARAGIGSAEVTGLTRGSLLIGYTAAVMGCTAIFAAALGIRTVPNALRYGGRISYGLYVFHSGTLQLSTWLVRPLHLAHLSGLYMITVDTIALALAIGAAHLSYQYFEKPFLLLKERFEVVRSRPA